MTKATNTIASAADLGAAIGAAHAGMELSAQAVHRTFIKAAPDVQADMRRDFKVNYVHAYCTRKGVTCTHAQATNAVDVGKRDAGKYAAAVNAASAACTYYLANGGGKAVKVDQKPEVTLTRAQLALIKACHAAGVTVKMFGQGVAQITK